MLSLLIDLDGVLYEGDDPIPGAADAMEWLDVDAIPHVFVTNTTSRPRSAIVEKLAKMGISIREDDILTPPVAAAAWLSENSHGVASQYGRNVTRDNGRGPQQCGRRRPGLCLADADS